jgi:hypothetical protein
MVTALKSRTGAPKTRTKFLQQFVRDIGTKMTTIRSLCIAFDPGFEYKELCEFRDLAAVNQADAPFSEI